MGFIISTTDNGFINMDMSEREAYRMRKPAFNRETNLFALKVAETVAGHTQVSRMSFKKKRGVASWGWTAVFIDKVKREKFLAAMNEEA